MKQNAEDAAFPAGQNLPETFAELLPEFLFQFQIDRYPEKRGDFEKMPPSAEKRYTEPPQKIKYTLCGNLKIRSVYQQKISLFFCFQNDWEIVQFFRKFR